MDENIHVLGDAPQNGDMPKSGYSPNNQAKAASMAISHALTGPRAFKPRFSNTCWSLISPDNGVKVGASYIATDKKIAKVAGFISQNNEDDALRKQTYEESLSWYAGIISDMFG
ncbi:FCSD flavin-binding domain-containing protein [Pseudovibrio sp. Ad26]|uniref:FCSD flavin-binding domain-containing protein n=1 Tax=Pseudovibrio sp. Ad26 TaxID=989410 RepID=UPI0007AE4951|nr:FCSD flavin-binding domain-containing protein [Pseudovibrio sp. Ad26]